MKKLFIAPVLVAAFSIAAVSFASELHYQPGGEPTCKSEEEGGCAVGHKVAQEAKPVSPQADCFGFETAVVGAQTKVPANDIAVMIIADLCKAPSKAVTDCVNDALLAARGQGRPVSSAAGLDAVVKMCSAASGSPTAASSAATKAPESGVP